MSRWLLACELGAWLGKLIVALWCCVALAVAEGPPRLLLPFTVNHCHDADTLRGDIVLPPPLNITLRDVEVRVQGADAWEVTRTRRTVTVTDAEIKKGIVARDAVDDLTRKQATQVYVEPTDNHDPYGRAPFNVVVWIKDKPLIELKEWLKANGHVRTK